MKMMIVDDSEMMRKMIRDVVAAPSDVISECADGVDVVSVFRRERPDVVLMDLHMGTVGGIAATQALKREFPDSTIIIVSNFHDQEFRDEAAAAGAVSYFVKDDLLKLQDYLRRLI